MARKNIFQLVEENYNIHKEIKKINDLFYSGEYFYINYDDSDFYTIVDEYLFNDWKFRDTCLDIEEYFKRAEGDISQNPYQRDSEDQIINYLEVIENFIKLYIDNADTLLKKYRIQCCQNFKTIFCYLIKTLEKRMGLIVREHKDYVVLYPKNAPLEKVIDLCEDEDVQWELIRYVREDLSLAEKRKSLAYLATNLSIESDDNEQDSHIKSLVKKAENILNNLHIRHNNQTGKWENKVLEDLDEKDAISLCDMVYNEMLTIVLLRDHKEYDKIYTEFTKKQKELKVKKKAEDKINGQA